MAENFHLIGSAYSSKKGSDANPGTALLPDKSVNGGLSDTAASDYLILGAGQYSENITQSGNKGIKADGLVILEGKNTFTWNLQTGSTSIISENLIVRNYNITSVATAAAVHKCQIENSVLTNSAGTGVIWESTVFRDNTWSNTAGTFMVLRYCIIINDSLSSITECKNNYIDEFASLFWINGGSSFNNNCINGKVAIPQDGAVSGAAVNNVPLSFSNLSPSWDGLSPVFVDEYPAFVLNNFTGDAQFLDIANKIYLVEPSSVLLFKASDAGENVGRVKVGELLKPNTADMPLVNGTGLTGTSDLTLTGSTGNIFSSVLGDGNPKVMGEMPYIGLLQNDSDDAANTAFNNNVPDLNENPPIAGDDNPDRNGFLIEWTTGNDPNPATWTDSAIFQFGLNEQSKPVIDSSGNGNGNANFDPLTASEIIYTYRRITIFLIEGKV